ncbi:hypothetical protein I6N90_05415 [Paenibacillus sp. GSMTC-2017]|uniref:hypothetical protein n=1 Tax=Paenibacillus sp. GSMTC-2017 TaxID=2794350 RepID=UPI0018D9393E|nr:hypothetical protein [Paenibacillus sp. GSMTC-2017]MBH5317248.1 hypothetical protein [Paenibacillus sp. GSMTC-2017]
MMVKKDKGAGRGKHLFYVVIASGILFYALSQFERSNLQEGANLFWFVWMAFSAIIIAANINMLLFMNEKKRKQLARIKRAKSVQMEQAIEKGITKYMGSKRRANGE